MALSRLAALFAAEIRNHDWSDAPYRADKAGHRRSSDGRSASPKQMSHGETESTRVNVVWVTGQVFAYTDPNFDIYEYAEACGVAPMYLRTTDGRPSRVIEYGLRWDGEPGEPRRYHRPGTYEADPAPPAPEALWELLTPEEQAEVRDARRTGLVSEAVYQKLVGAGGVAWSWQVGDNPPTYYMPRAFRAWLRKRFDRPAS